MSLTDRIVNSVKNIKSIELILKNRSYWELGFYRYHHYRVICIADLRKEDVSFSSDMRQKLLSLQLEANEKYNETLEQGLKAILEEEKIFIKSVDEGIK